ncbi:MAG: DNA cytosine methyltransferase [Candidatus Nanopelagicales bacterium]
MANVQPVTTLDAFAGPGGWAEGSRILQKHRSVLGIEIDPHACASAVSAGHRRLQADIRSIDPADYPYIKGFKASPPCPTFSASGKRSGLGNDYQVILDAVTHAGSHECDCPWSEIEEELGGVEDPRTALAAQTIRFALGLPNLEWLVMEQVPACEYLWEDVAAELISSGWESADVFTIDAMDLGMPVRRKRVFLVARRYRCLGGRGVDHPAMVFEPRRSMAHALGWGAGHQIRTRGNRKATGGNLFSADMASWCVTEKARSWCREDDGLRLTSAEAGLLQGFRRDYPWTGSRTRQFGQLADVVCPPVAAAVIGYATGTPWLGPVRAHLASLYPATLTRSAA